MSWTDIKSIEVIKYLRDKYKIDTFVETGTFKGINAKLHSKNFNTVFTCEKVPEYWETSNKRMTGILNTFIYKKNSPEFLKKFVETSNKGFMFYLDAHFYDKKLPKNKRFVVLEELVSLGRKNNSVIIIHDFDNGLGHITYDGVDLDMDLLRNKLKKVNPNFYYYTNTLDGCKPVPLDKEKIEEAGLDYDEDTIDNLKYAWLSPRLTYRGILYCLPSKLTKNEIKNLGLRECN